MKTLDKTLLILVMCLVSYVPSANAQQTVPKERVGTCPDVLSGRHSSDPRPEATGIFHCTTLAGHSSSPTNVR
jgi:hypothetical protein